MYRGGGIAIIPSVKLYYKERQKKTEVCRLYEEMISSVLETSEYVVYIVAHSEEDVSLCKILAGKFQDNRRVFLCTENYDFREMEEVLAEFKFIIASRYHSVVHAYRAGRPCIVLGWADKYMELMRKFDQTKYCLDIRKGLDYMNFEKAIGTMLVSYNEEAEKIKDRMKLIKEENIYCFEGTLNEATYRE